MIAMRIAIGNNHQSWAGLGWLYLNVVLMSPTDQIAGHDDGETHKSVYKNSTRLQFDYIGTLIAIDQIVIELLCSRVVGLIVVVVVGQGLMLLLWLLVVQHPCGVRSSYHA